MEKRDGWKEVWALLELFSRLVVGGLFLYAGWMKAMDVYGFAKTVYGYGILPGFLVNLAAIVLPWVEVVAGIFMMAGIWPRAASGLVAGLLLIFMGAIVYNISRGYTFDCGCFGAGDGQTGWGTVGRDVLMLLPTFFVLLFSGKRRWALWGRG